jgi:tetrahydromethanopterin S-methyltransferase subunit B
MFLIEKDTNTGLVYKNNVDKFITMNITDIIEQSMEKLNKHLNDFYQRIC